MTYKETEDIWRLYCREWVAVHTLDTVRAEDARPVFEAGMQWIKENLTGRVPDGDINMRIFTDQHGIFWGQVIVYKDNLKGEFKQRSNAELHAKITDLEEYTIVPRNSKADHQIRNYGVTKL